MVAQSTISKDDHECGHHKQDKDKDKDKDKDNILPFRIICDDEKKHEHQHKILYVGEDEDENETCFPNSFCNKSLSNLFDMFSKMTNSFQSP